MNAPAAEHGLGSWGCGQLCSFRAVPLGAFAVLRLKPAPEDGIWDGKLTRNRSKRLILAVSWRRGRPPEIEELHGFRGYFGVCPIQYPHRRGLARP
jgi:hypothetical protein